jgi:CMP-N-acetylneuraminic acid synthetase
LANDTARVPEVVHRYLLDLDPTARPEVIAVVLPPCPFRTARHIEEAYALFERENPQGFLVSISPYDFPPQFAVRFQAQVPRLDLVQPEVYATTTRSQSVERLLHPNGAIYLCAVEPFLRTQSFFSEPLIGYEMSPEDSLDVDWPHQFAIAESLFAQRISQSPS